MKLPFASFSVFPSCALLCCTSSVLNSVAFSLRMSLVHTYAAKIMTSILQKLMIPLYPCLMHIVQQQQQLATSAMSTA